jgi:hypothetical protein
MPNADSISQKRSGIKASPSRNASTPAERIVRAGIIGYQTRATLVSRKSSGRAVIIRAIVAQDMIDNMQHFKPGTGKWVDSEECQPYNEIGWPIFIPPEW